MVNVYDGNLTSKMRVRKTFAHEKTDRVPINYFSNHTVHMRFAKALGVPDGDHEQVLRRLGADFRMVNPRYTGPELFAQIENRHVDALWGDHSRWVANDYGGYWDYCDFPLIEADEETVAGWPTPNPDDFDYEGTLDYCKAMKDFGLHAGNPGMADILNSNGKLRGVEQTLVDFITDNPAGLLLTDKRTESNLGMLDRLLAKCGEYIDFVWIGEDLGSQHCPLISMELYRKHLKPRHMRFIECAKSYGKPVMIHTCGSSSWVYEEFIEMGISAVDTLQPEATNMDPKYLKQNFGGRLSFHGCISTAGPLAYGTADETAACVKETLGIMMPGGGYFLSPTHSIQDNTPTENLAAMYNTAHEYGRYK
ncbi:MAG: hypothetical protein FWE82_06315 [Defluviitaleaceae bacterium]|nr:hypothetical protein [Defluviitaleaceae bacterium]